MAMTRSSKKLTGRPDLTCIYMPVYVEPRMAEQLLFFQRMHGTPPFIKFEPGFTRCGVYGLSNAQNRSLTLAMISQTRPQEYETVFDTNFYAHERHTTSFPFYELLIQGLSSPFSTLRSAFMVHPLAEKQVLFVILDFL